MCTVLITEITPRTLCATSLYQSCTAHRCPRRLRLGDYATRRGCPPLSMFMGTEGIPLQEPRGQPEFFLRFRRGAASPCTSRTRAWRRTGEGWAWSWALESLEAKGSGVVEDLARIYRLVERTPLIAAPHPHHPLPHLDAIACKQHWNNSGFGVTHR